MSMDGVRQDFVIAKRPPGTGDLRVELAVTGAEPRPLAYGARLVLDGSGRKLAYNRLRAVDAQGRELAARMEVTAATRLAVRGGGCRRPPIRCALTPPSAMPTGSAWEPFPGRMIGCMRRWWMVLAISTLAATSRRGRISIANCIAKWDGSAWSALGSGMEGQLWPSVGALAVSGTDTCMREAASRRRAGAPANRIAKWNGSAWSALGSGMNGRCLCAGGVGHGSVCGRQLHHGGWGRGQPDCQMEREHLVGLGFGDGRQLGLGCAGGVRHGPVCGRRFHYGGRSASQPYCQMERERLVGLGLGMNSMRHLRWRCRARICMRGAVSPRRAGRRPTALPNGTAARGRPWARG